MDNNFQVDTSKQVKKDFLKKTKIPLGIAFLLTAIKTVAAILFFIKGISGAVWNEMGVYEFAVKSLHLASIVCIFLCLIKLIVDGKPFSHSFSICTRIIAGLYFLSSVLFPRIPGFATDYSIFQFGSFTLIDANFLIKALLLYVFSVIIQEGFFLQKDMEEIL
jgi:hypothetical protein